MITRRRNYRKDASPSPASACRSISSGGLATTVLSTLYLLGLIQGAASNHYHDLHHPPSIRQRLHNKHQAGVEEGWHIAKDFRQQQQSLIQRQQKRKHRKPIHHWRFLSSSNTSPQSRWFRRRTCTCTLNEGNEEESCLWRIRGGGLNVPDSSSTSNYPYSSSASDAVLPPSSWSSSSSDPSSPPPSHQSQPPPLITPTSIMPPPPPPSSSASSLSSSAAAPVGASSSSSALTLSSNGNGHQHYIPLPIPTTTPAKPRLLDVISIHANGTALQHQVRKSELSLELGCPTRDLRLIDTSFPSSVATFLARRSAIVLRMDRVRAVIRWGEVMLFDPFSKDVASLVPTFQQQLAAAALSPPGVVNSPFELMALEAILANVCHMVHEKLQQLSPHIARILGDLKFRYGTLSSFPKLLDELLPLRNDLSELHYTVQELRKALNDVLLSDEDMEKMHLSAIHAIGGGSGRGSCNSYSSNRGGQELDNDDEENRHQEVEMMFENYLMQLEWADTEIREIQHAIRNTEDTVEIQLDLLRNRILRFELVLNIVASVMSFGCLVTGLFGMNLLSGWESHPTAFYFVTIAGGAMMLAMLGLTLFYGAKGKLL